MSTEEFVPLRKSLGQKTSWVVSRQYPPDPQWYDDFKENDHVKIFDKNEFLYREYTVMQPLQRRGWITEETIEKAKSVPFLAKLFDEYSIKNY